MKSSNHLSDLIEIWGLEGDLMIFRDNSLGFILEISALDISCKRDELVNHLGEQIRHFLNGLPQFTDIQIIQEINQGNSNVITDHDKLGLSTSDTLCKLVLNEPKLKADLENNWAVVAEAIQTILRRENYPKPYEALKELTRGKSVIDKKVIHQFIASLKVSAPAPGRAYRVPGRPAGGRLCAA